MAKIFLLITLLVGAVYSQNVNCISPFVFAVDYQGSTYYSSFEAHNGTNLTPYFSEAESYVLSPGVGTAVSQDGSTLQVSNSIVPALVASKFSALDGKADDFDFQIRFTCQDGVLYPMVYDVDNGGDITKVPENGGLGGESPSMLVCYGKDYDDYSLIATTSELPLALDQGLINCESTTLRAISPAQDTTSGTSAMQGGQNTATAGAAPQSAATAGVFTSISQGSAPYKNATIATMSSFSTVVLLPNTQSQVTASIVTVVVTVQDIIVAGNAHKSYVTTTVSKMSTFTTGATVVLGTTTTVIPAVAGGAPITFSYTSTQAASLAATGTNDNAPAVVGQAATCVCSAPPVTLTAMLPVTVVQTINLQTSTFVTTFASTTLGVVTVQGGTISPTTSTITYQGIVATNTNAPLAPGQSYQTIQVTNSAGQVSVVNLIVTVVINTNDGVSSVSSMPVTPPASSSPPYVNGTSVPTTMVRSTTTSIGVPTVPNNSGETSQTTVNVVLSTLSSAARDAMAMGGSTIATEVAQSTATTSPAASSGPSTGSSGGEITCFTTPPTSDDGCEAFFNNLTPSFITSHLLNGRASAVSPDGTITLDPVQFRTPPAVFRLTIADQSTSSASHCLVDIINDDSVNPYVVPLATLVSTFRQIRAQCNANGRNQIGPDDPDFTGTGTKVIVIFNPSAP